MPPPSIQKSPPYREVGGNAPLMPPAVSPPKPPTSRPPVALPPSTKASPVLAHVPKTFAVKAWTGAGEGKKMLGYAKSGMGKTSLAAMAPGAIFIGLDDGGRLIKHPKTGADLNAIPGVETFQDLRDALRQTNLYSAGQTLVIDTITRGETLGEHFCFASIKTDKGETARNIEDYGYGKGYKHLLDTMRLIIGDLEPLVRKGVNILLLAQESQATVANLEGLDYLQDGPKLSNAKQYPVRTEFVEWVDLAFRIGHPNISVKGANLKATKGKVSGNTERYIYTSPELHFVAKARPIDGRQLPPVISFETPDDNSLWQFVFEGRTVDAAA